MLDLAAFQRNFIDLVGNGDRTRDAISIYRNTSTSATIDALRDNYPVTQKLVGQEMFDGIAWEFATACPTDTPVLATYGLAFAPWIEVQPWASDIPYLADVARFERLHVEALFAADAEPLAMEALADVVPDQWTEIQLILHPATRCGWVETPAMQIWAAHQLDECDLSSIDWQAEGGLFTRPDQQVEGHILDAFSLNFLASIANGQTVGAAAISAQSQFPDSDAGAVFAKLVRAGAFALQ